MFNFYEKRRFRRFFYSYLTLGILGFLVVMLAISVWGRFETEQMTREKREELALKRDALASRAHVLSSEIQKLGSERGVEEEVREKFEVGVPGEKLIVIVDPKKEELPLLPPPEPSFWARVRGWFE